MTVCCLNMRYFFRTVTLPRNICSLIRLNHEKITWNCLKTRIWTEFVSLFCLHVTESVQFQMTGLGWVSPRVCDGSEPTCWTYKDVYYTAEVLPPQTEKFLFLVCPFTSRLDPSWRHRQFCRVMIRPVFDFFHHDKNKMRQKKNHNNPALTFLPALCLKTATHKLEVTWKTTEVTTVERMLKGKLRIDVKTGSDATKPPDWLQMFADVSSSCAPEALNLTVRSVNVFLLQQTVRQRPARRPKISSLLVCSRTSQSRNTRTRTRTATLDVIWKSQRTSVTNSQSPRGKFDHYRRKYKISVPQK